MSILKYEWECLKLVFTSLSNDLFLLKLYYKQIFIVLFNYYSFAITTERSDYLWKLCIGVLKKPTKYSCCSHNKKKKGSVCYACFAFSFINILSAVESRVAWYFYKQISHQHVFPFILLCFWPLKHTQAHKRPHTVCQKLTFPFVFISLSSSGTVCLSVSKRRNPLYWESADPCIFLCC